MPDQIVVPTFEGMFAEMNAELPGITQTVVDASDVVAAYGLYAIGALIVVGDVAGDPDPVEPHAFKGPVAKPMFVPHDLVDPGQSGNGATDRHSQNRIFADADPGAFGGCRIKAYRSNFISDLGAF